MRWRDRPSIRRLMARGAGASVGAEALKERVVGIDSTGRVERANDSRVIGKRQDMRVGLIGRRPDRGADGDRGRDDNGQVASCALHQIRSLLRATSPTPYTLEAQNFRKTAHEDYGAARNGVSSRSRSHARANSQSRLREATEMPRTSAVSVSTSPPKNRNSTTRLARGSMAARGSAPRKWARSLTGRIESMAEPADHLRTLFDAALAQAGADRAAFVRESCPDEGLRIELYSPARGPRLCAVPASARPAPRACDNQATSTI